MEDFVIKAKLRWANVNEVTGPNSMSNKFQVDITEMSKEAVEKLKFFNVEPREKEGVTFVTAKSNRPVLVLDKNKEPLTQVRLGNGTLANVQVRPYEWEFKGKKGVGLGLQKIQVIDLVELEKDLFNAEASEPGADEIPF